MRLPILIAGLTLPLAAAAAQPLPQGPLRSYPAQSDCYGKIFHYADADKKAARTLGELPPGNLVLTVVRQVGGCQRPVIVRYGIGAGAPEASGDRRKRSGRGPG